MLRTRFTAEAVCGGLPHDVEEGRDGLELHLETHGERVKKTLFDAIESVKYTFGHYVECLRHFLTLQNVYKTLFDTGGQKWYSRGVPDLRTCAN